MKPKVTVLMSVYNGERFLREAIDSILAQTWRDFEFLIINDGSTDRSREIILSYKDPRIKLVDNERNIGLTRSLNKGLKLAKGEYIARMDADDVSLPQRLERQVEYLERNPQVVLLGTWAQVIDGRSGEVAYKWELPTTCCLIKWRLLFNNCLIHPSVMYGKEKALSVGGYSESSAYAQDYGLWVKLSRQGEIAQLPEYLLKCRKFVKEQIGYKYLNDQQGAAKQIAFDYLKTILSDIDYEGFQHLFHKLQAFYNLQTQELDYSGVKEVVAFINKARDRFFEAHHLDAVCRKEILEDIKECLKSWAGGNKNRPRICFYLIFSYLKLERDKFI